MSMTAWLIVAVSTSFAVGIGLGRWWGKHAHSNVLVADAGEAAEMRSEAAKSVAERTQRRMERILARTAELGSITNDDVEDLFCISNRTATAYLTRLTRRGKLLRQGSGRGTHYILK